MSLTTADLNEGFPDMTAREFVQMFMRANGLPVDWAFVNRIEFEYVEATA